MMIYTLYEEPSAFNLQKLFLNDNFTELFGQYVIVHNVSGHSYICRVWRKLLHDNYCILSDSVEYLETSISSSCKYNYILPENIEVIPKINTIRNVGLTVIFKDAYERVKWKDKNKDLCDTVRDILQLFVFCSNTHINVGGIKELKAVGIDSLRIVSVGIKGVGVVTPATNIKLMSLQSLKTFSQLEIEKPLEVVDQKEVYIELKDILTSRTVPKLPLEPPSQFFQQVLLIGPGGCGKKTLVKKVCHEVGAVVLELDLAQVSETRASQAQTVFSETLTLARLSAQESPSGLCIILVFRIENFCVKPCKILALLTTLLDNISREPNILIIATTDSPHVLHHSLRTSTHLGTELYMSIPDESERESIISHFCKNFELKEEVLKEIAVNTPGFVLSDILLLVNRVSRTLTSLTKKDCDAVLDAFRSSIQLTVPASRKGQIGSVPKISYSMEQLGGLETVKNSLMQVVVWPLLHHENFRLLNIQHSSGVLLYGPPGCAKTSLARAIASSTKTSFLSVSAADLYSPFVGEAEKIITHLFQRARASAPTILFVDEIDALVGCRSDKEKGVQERILTCFLTEMDGIGVRMDEQPGMAGKFHPFVFVVAATNRPQVIDSALLRPGRLDRLIYVPPPSSLDRLDILKKITSRMPLDGDVCLSTIAEGTEFYSGADLANLCREAGLVALTVDGMEASCIRQVHFFKALSTIKPSLSAEQIRSYSQFTFGF